MYRFKDFLHVSKTSFKETFSKIGKSYMVFIFIFINTIFENNHFNLGLVGGVVGGIINYFIGVVITSFVLQSLSSVVKYGNTGKKSLENSIGNFLPSLIETMFYVYLIEMFSDLLLVNFPFKFKLVFYFIIQLILSAIYEEIYLNGRSGIDAIRQSAIFVKNNCIHYGLYAAIFILAEIFMQVKLGIGLGISKNTIIYHVIYALVHSFFMLFRGHLFKYLNQHSFRQRKFMRGY